ncbi:MAG: RNA 2',3'-cyclic phosphodiesterase [Anaerolineales bacterium]
MRYRIFAALELSPALRESLARVQDNLSRTVPGDDVRWSRLEGVHLTVKFYGDVDSERLAEIEMGLARAAAQAAPVRLAVEGLGVFPNPQRPQVIWAGLAGDLGGLQALQAAVEREAAALGFEPEEREYTPHLTLGRVNARLSANAHGALIDYLAEARHMLLGQIEADQLTLLRSQLKPGGSVYNVLFTAPLGAPANAGALPTDEENSPGNN